MTPPTSDAPSLLGLVADDLTGAADAAAGFAEHGWRVLLQLRPDVQDVGPAAGPGRDGPGVLAVVTHVRALPDQQAAAATRTAVDALVRAGVERLFVKVDSTARGSVAGQVEGALAAWSATRGRAAAVVCPAFPALGRTVEDGVVHVDGVDAATTAAATDPVTPLGTADLATLLPGSVRGTPAEVGTASRLLVDARTDAELDVLAARVARAGATVVAVGSGGLAAALGRCWHHPSPRVEVATGGPVLVAVSSLHPVTSAQLSHLRDADTTQAVLTTGPDLTAHPEQAARELARRVAAALAVHPYGALLLVGGDGAAAVLEHLGAEALVVDGTVLGGCPTGVLSGGVADGLRVVTKSGGFGGPGDLTEIVARLDAPAPAARSAPPPLPLPVDAKDAP